MKLFTWIIMTCYITLFILLGIGLVAFSLQWIPLDGAVLWLEMAYQEKNLRLAFFLTGIGLILLNWMYAELTLSKAQRQKTIAFDNPDGQVTVSLSAIEDLIHRATSEVPEVKELRSDVVARKGRILVRVRATLWSEARIPQVTEKIQSVVRNRIQEMLAGIEEPVLVRVHVSKIAHHEAKDSETGQQPEQTVTPFRGL